MQNGRTYPVTESVDVFVIRGQIDNARLRIIARYQRAFGHTARIQIAPATIIDGGDE